MVSSSDHVSGSGEVKWQGVCVWGGGVGRCVCVSVGVVVKWKFGKERERE